jgi:hypothetical protein
MSMPTDGDRIEASRLRQGHGHADAIDTWRLRRADRREIVRKDTVSDDVVYQDRQDALVEPEVMDAQISERWNNWARDNVLRVFDSELAPMLRDALGEALGLKARELRDHFREEIHRLELAIAELRGEVNALSAERTSKLWRPH